MAGRSEPDAERLLGVYATEMVSLHKRMLGAGYAKAFVDLDLLKVEMSRDAGGSSASRAWALRRVGVACGGIASREPCVVWRVGCGRELGVACVGITCGQRGWHRFW